MSDLRGFTYEDGIVAGLEMATMAIEPLPENEHVLSVLRAEVDRRKARLQPPQPPGRSSIFAAIRAFEGKPWQELPQGDTAVTATHPGGNYAALGVTLVPARDEQDDDEP